MIDLNFTRNQVIEALEFTIKLDTDPKVIEEAIMKASAEELTLLSSVLMLNDKRFFLGFIMALKLVELKENAKLQELMKR